MITQNLQPAKQILENYDRREKSKQYIWGLNWNWAVHCQTKSHKTSKYDQIMASSLLMNKRFPTDVISAQYVSIEPQGMKLSLFIFIWFAVLFIRTLIAFKSVKRLGSKEWSEERLSYFTLHMGRCGSLRLTSKLSHFKSKWTIFFECKYSMPKAASMAIISFLRRSSDLHKFQNLRIHIKNC